MKLLGNRERESGNPTEFLRNPALLLQTGGALWKQFHLPGPENPRRLLEVWNVFRDRVILACGCDQYEMKTGVIDLAQDRWERLVCFLIIGDLPPGSHSNVTMNNTSGSWSMDLKRSSKLSMWAVWPFAALLLSLSTPPLFAQQGAKDKKGLDPLPPGTLQVKLANQEKR